MREEAIFILLRIEVIFPYRHPMKLVSRFYSEDILMFDILIGHLRRVKRMIRDNCLMI